MASSTCPDVFMKGVAISVWQNSGDEASNWAKYLKSKYPFGSVGVKTFRGKYSVDHSPDFWNRYKEDVVCAHKLGCNAFRLSIEWARIEPKQGEYDEEAIQRYHDILDEMERRNIEPMASLHHFVHPAWFDGLGGFEEEENIKVFVTWAQKAYSLYGTRIRLWGTFNEPTCAMFLGWITGFHPPGKIGQFFTAGRVLLNMLRAHDETYAAIKALPGGQSASIGLVHHHITFVPRGNGLLYAPAKWMSGWLTYWWGHDVVHTWLATGVFEWKVPVLGKCIWYRCPTGRPPMDWFGINYYSRAVLSWTLSPTVMAGEVMTGMFYPIYSEGLYKACMRARDFGVPIYITETGITTDNEDHRKLMIVSYLEQMLRAIRDGSDVRGVYYWTLVDNFEWCFGFDMKFGLYAWEPDGSCDRQLKEGSAALVRHYATMPTALSELRALVHKLPLDAVAAAQADLRRVAEQQDGELLVPLAAPA